MLLDEPKNNVAALYTLTEGFCGFEAATTFQDFAQNYERVVTVDDILVLGNFDKVADYTINEHAALVEKMGATVSFENELPSEQVQNMAVYFVSLPSEVAMKLWTVYSSGHVNNTIGLHKAMVNGKAVSSHIVE
jgi:ribosomal protein L10